MRGGAPGTGAAKNSAPSNVNGAASTLRVRSGTHGSGRRTSRAGSPLNRRAPVGAQVRQASPTPTAHSMLTLPSSPRKASQVSQRSRARARKRSSTVCASRRRSGMPARISSFAVATYRKVSTRRSARGRASWLPTREPRPCSCAMRAQSQ